jgi:hypothetical protein
MFFWQASGEVEEEKSHNIKSKFGRPVLVEAIFENICA